MRYTPRLYNDNDASRSEGLTDRETWTRERGVSGMEEPLHWGRPVDYNRTTVTRSYAPRLYNDGEVGEAERIIMRMNEQGGSSPVRGRSAGRAREVGGGTGSESVGRLDAYGYVITDEDARRTASMGGGEELPPSYDAAMSNAGENDRPRSRQ